MNIPLYWAKAPCSVRDRHGRPHTCSVWGWSSTSLQDAQEHARDRAADIASAAAQARDLQDYEYGQGPLREEIVERIGDPAAPVALVTRNRYGALVLNTARVLFVDIDPPPAAAAGLLDAILSIFSSGRRASLRQAAIHSAIQQVESWSAANASRSFRLYRTCEGLRLLFTDRLYDPAAAETLDLLQQLNADPMYVKLTQRQECFRARLTAKPWRCGCPRPPGAFPWSSPEAERTYRQWQAQYSQLDSGYRACQLHQQYGRPAAIPELAVVIEAHDRGARIASTAPLA